MNRLGFKTTLVVTMALITALAVGVSNFINYQSISSEFKRLVYSDTQQRIHVERNLLSEFVKARANSVSNLADDYRKYNYTANHAERMRVAAISGHIPNLTIGFSNGDAYCAAEVPGWDNFKNPPTYDPTKRPWFIDGMSATGLIYTEPYEDATTKELMVSIGKKAGDNAVILADIPLAILTEAVESFDMKGL
ncbi:hypothetical protein [Vibrio salinus]|uniref:hypothetical protein n=1 Tax=Vibrio salinus TaxID=2899784 RepID=UPI001E33B57C|nr:hypothetical protein [Vibrio salinus]MCE0495904.1 hypothetical protein [Vibrio salinus]